MPHVLRFLWFRGLHPLGSNYELTKAKNDGATYDDEKFGTAGMSSPANVSKTEFDASATPAALCLAESVLNRGLDASILQAAATPEPAFTMPANSEFGMEASASDLPKA